MAANELWDQMKKLEALLFGNKASTDIPSQPTDTDTLLDPLAGTNSTEDPLITTINRIYTEPESVTPSDIDQAARSIYLMIYPEDETKQPSEKEQYTAEVYGLDIRDFLVNQNAEPDIATLGSLLILHYTFPHWAANNPQFARYLLHHSTRLQNMLPPEDFGNLQLELQPLLPSACQPSLLKESLVRLENSHPECYQIYLAVPQEFQSLIGEYVIWLQNRNTSSDSNREISIKWSDPRSGEVRLIISINDLQIGLNLNPKIKTEEKRYSATSGIIIDSHGFSTSQSKGIFCNACNHPEPLAGKLGEELEAKVVIFDPQINRGAIAEITNHLPATSQTNRELAYSSNPKALIAYFLKP